MYCTYKRNNEARSCNHFYSGQAIRITYSECVCVCVSSLTYSACNVHAPYSHIACPALLYFSTLSHKLHDFGGNKMNIKCVLIFSTILPEIFLILRRTE